MRRLAIAISIVAAIPVLPQEQPPAASDGERGLWSTEFRESRALTQPLLPRGEARPKNTPPAARPSDGLMLGLTAWRLRMPQPSETVRLIVHEGSQAAEYTPERIGAATMLAHGDRMRISVEPGRTGYLYIASREIYTGAKTGNAYLVFPSQRIRGGRARVSPGELVEVPEWNNERPYLTLKRTSPEQSGEQLILLLTQAELPGLMAKSPPIPLPAGTLEEWVRRWGAGVRMLDTPDQKGVVLSAAEQRAAANSVPLRSGDPIPQILFRAPATAQDGLLATFTLRLNP